VSDVPARLDLPKPPVHSEADEKAVVERYEPFFDQIIEGKPVRKALKACGEAYTTFMRLKREYPALQAAYDQARKDASELDEENAVEVIRRARGATPEEITRANYESRALVWRAGARNAMRYRNQATDGNGNVTSVQVMIINGQEVKF
jgi:hypothetical protein